MSAQQPRYSAEETAWRGDALYKRTICAQVEATHYGKVVAIDIETGAYAVDDTALAAARRLRAQHPDAAVWFVRIGHRALHRIGRRPIGVGRLWSGVSF
jgi:hypothetical protein